MDKVRLVKQCQAGDRNAWELLYRHYLPSMRRVVAYHVHDSEAVNDILHDGFIIAFASIGTLNNDTKLEAWLTSIMKNLAIQHLRDESSHRSVSLADAPLADKAEESKPLDGELTWEELNSIIDKLPQGYGKVFRMAVLDGMSHKRIGALLGIAPHSSSSQLAHAKALLRRMITRYRFEMGAISVVVLLLLVWQGVFRQKPQLPSSPMLSDDHTPQISAISDTIPHKIIKKDATPAVPAKPVVRNVYRPQPEQQLAQAVTEAADTATITVPDSLPTDSIMHIPSIKGLEELYAQADLPPATFDDDDHDWALSLAYSGNLGHDNTNRYNQFISGDPDSNTPSTEIEVAEKTKHYMPLVIGLSLNKSITSHWSIDAGLRYTFLRSDILTKSELTDKQIVQKIHYLGVPLKVNYRIITLGGFSLYGQGGAALDIPVNGKQSHWKLNWNMNSPQTETRRIHAPLQWSVEGGLGLQYHITPSLSIYAEPSVRYYFNPNSEIKTIRQEKPFEFTLPIGLRLNW